MAVILTKTGAFMNKYLRICEKLNLPYDVIFDKKLKNFFKKI